MVKLKDDLHNLRSAKNLRPYDKFYNLEILERAAMDIAASSFLGPEAIADVKRISDEIKDLQKRVRQHKEWETRRTTTLVLAEKLIRRVSSEFSGSNGLQLTSARQCVQEAKDLAPQLRALAVEARNLATEGMIGTEELDEIMMRATEVEVTERELGAAIPNIQKAHDIGYRAQQLRKEILNLNRDIIKEKKTAKKEKLAKMLDGMEEFLKQNRKLNSEVEAFPPPNRFIPKHVIDRWKQDLDYASRTGEGCLAGVNNA